MHPAIPGTARALRRLAGAEPGAWDEVCALQATPLLRVTSAVAGPDGGEDACHEAFVLVHRNASRFRGDDDEHAQAWLNRLAINAALAYRRRGRRRARRERPIAGDEAMASDATGPALDADERAAILDGIARLRPGERELIVARFWEEQPLAAIAHRRGVAEGTLRVRLHRALARLRRVLAVSAPALAALADEALLAAPTVPPSIAAREGLLARLRLVPSHAGPSAAARVAAAAAAIAVVAMVVILAWLTRPAAEDARTWAPVVAAAPTSVALPAPGSDPGPAASPTPGPLLSLERDVGPTIAAAYTRFGGRPVESAPEMELETVRISWSGADAPGIDQTSFPFRLPDRVMRSLPAAIVVQQAIGPARDPARAHLCVGGGSGDGRHRAVLMPCAPIDAWLRRREPGRALELRRPARPSLVDGKLAVDPHSELAALLQAKLATGGGGPLVLDSADADDARIQAMLGEPRLRMRARDPRADDLFSAQQTMQISVPLDPREDADAVAPDGAG